MQQHQQATTVPAYPKDSFGTFDSVEYLLQKEHTRVHMGIMVMSRLPYTFVECYSKDRAIALDIAKLRWGIMPGTFVNTTTPTNYASRNTIKSVEDALIRAVATVVAPRHGIDYLDNILVDETERGVFTLAEFGGYGGNNHAFHSQTVTSDSTRAEILDRFYNAAREHLTTITSEPFEEAKREMGRFFGVTKRYKTTPKKIMNAAFKRAKTLVPPEILHARKKYPTEVQREAALHTTGYYFDYDDDDP